MNNRFFKTLRLYLKTAVNPFTTAFSLILLVGLPIALIHDPAVIGDDDYGSMIGAAGMGHMGTIVFLILGTIFSSHMKFFVSIADAKRFMTTVPLAVAAGLSLIYDAVIVTIALLFLSPQTTADLMLICAADTVIAVFAASAIGKNGLTPLYLIFLLMISFQTIFFNGNGRFDFGFGVSLANAAVISGVIVIAGFAANIAVLNIWWKKCDRIPRKINTLMPMSTVE